MTSLEEQKLVDIMDNYTARKLDKFKQGLKYCTKRDIVDLIDLAKSKYCIPPFRMLMILQEHL